MKWCRGVKQRDLHSALLSIDTKEMMMTIAMTATTGTAERISKWGG